jgi:glutamate 5-kinase
VVDHGAENALLTGGKSLLPAGITDVSGDFCPGDVIEVQNAKRQSIGRGIVNYAAWQLHMVAGMSTEEALKQVEVTRMEVIHRDEWMTV